MKYRPMKYHSLMFYVVAFHDFNLDVLKEEWIDQNYSLTKNVKEKALKFYTSLQKVIEN